MTAIARLYLTCATLVVVGLSTRSATAAEHDWPRWRGPDLNGISKETGWSINWPAAGPKTLWKASVGIGFASVSVVQGRVFTAGNRNNQDTIFAFDAKTGREIWKHSYDSALDPRYYEGGTSATPTVDGDRVYTLGRKGHVFCLDAATGKVIWSSRLA